MDISAIAFGSVSTGSDQSMEFKDWKSVEASESHADENNPSFLRLPNAPAKGDSIATQVRPRFDLLLPGEPCALDIEFLNFRQKAQAGTWKLAQSRWRTRPAWIGITNSRGETVLDVFIKYPYDKDIETMVPRAPGKDFGVTRERLDKFNGAVAGPTAERWCKEICTDRPVVVHAGHNDRSSFQYGDPFARATAVHDTQIEWASAEEGSGDRTPGLATLAAALIGVEIQRDGIHGPVEDAATTMKIHLLKHPYDRAEEAKKWESVFAASSHAQNAARGSGPLRVRGNRGGRGGRRGHGGRGGCGASRFQNHARACMSVPEGDRKTIPAQLRNEDARHFFSQGEDSLRLVHQPTTRQTDKSFNLASSSNSNNLPAAMVQAAENRTIHDGNNACSGCRSGNGPWTECATLLGELTHQSNRDGDKENDPTQGH